MSWQLLLAVATIFYSISVVLQRVLMKADKSDPISYSIAFQLFVGIITGIYALVNGFRLPNLVPFIPNLVFMTALYGFGNIFIFKSLKLVDASTFTIIFASRTLWIVVGAILFLGETFSPQQCIGTALILGSIALVAWNGKQNIFRHGIGTVILAALCMGAGFTNDAFIISSFDTPSYVTIIFLIPSIVLWCIYPKSTKSMIQLLHKKTLWKLILLAGFYAIAAIAIFLAYQVGKNASQIAPLNQTSTILIVLLSMIFLGERSDYLKKIIGAVISFIGVLLVM